MTPDDDFIAVKRRIEFREGTLSCAHLHECLVVVALLVARGGTPL